MNATQALIIYSTVLLPLLGLITFFTPAEWWNSLYDDSAISMSANVILNAEMRLGRWETK